MYACNTMLYFYKRTSVLFFLLFYTVLTNNYIIMSTRTEQERKQDVYNKIMDIFIQEYDDAIEIVSTVSIEMEDNREIFYDLLQAQGVFCLRNNPEAYPLSIRLDDYITSLSHILAEKKRREKERA